MTVSRSIHVSANGTILFLFIAESMKILDATHSSILASVEHNWVCFTILQLSSTTKSLQSCLTLCDSTDVACKTPLPWVLQSRILWVAVSFSRGSSWPRDQAQASPVPPALAGRFTSELPGKPQSSFLSSLSPYPHSKWHCVYVLHLLYPFLCQWTFWLLPCPGYCK